MVPGPPPARSVPITLRLTTSLALRSRKQSIPRDFSSGAWSRKPKPGPEANFVERIDHPASAARVLDRLAITRALRKKKDLAAGLRTPPTLLARSSAGIPTRLSEQSSP